MKILFGSQTGTAREWAHTLGEQVTKRGYQVTVLNLADYDPDELTYENLLLFVISTYTDGKPPEACIPFYEWLQDHSLDFRVHRTAYQDIKFGVFGIGSSIYGKKRFNATGRQLDKMLSRLSAKPIVPLGAGDNGAGVEISEGFDKWTKKLWPALERAATAGANISDKQEIKVSNEPEDDSEPEEDGEPLADVEDIGVMMKKTKKPTKQVTQEEEEESSDEEDEELTLTGSPKEMLTPSLRKALTKQGYRLLGSHSGVKMCRWTKAMLRGRGGCYKHTFYGISSYQCMEMTPSLACANKCVFCWRHHKNPVGKEWRWQADGPEDLITLALKNHKDMIKQMKGVPGVEKERFEEAFTVRHCALSLVGEPIIYPYINEFVDLLHSKDISSFLVTNAQFPDKIVTLFFFFFGHLPFFFLITSPQDAINPVTQLYVSVDAATKDSLQKVDRPLFADFWERFLSCLDSLSRKGQRTVYRLTLIKEWNVDELLNYGQLVERGKPSFIEIKGVTYCGTSKASTLTMKNVPFHEEVVRFCEELISSTPFLSENYELACEHEHVSAHPNFFFSLLLTPTSFFFF